MHRLAIEVQAMTLDEQPAAACEDCGGRGWVVALDGTAGSAKPCLCREREPLEDRLRRAGVWERFLGARREEWREDRDPWPTSSLAELGSKRPLLTLWGPTGTGKTTLATAILREHLETGRRGKWVHLPTWLTEHRELIADDRHGASLAARRALAGYPHLLVLDELFSRAAAGGSATDFELEAVPGLVCGRDGRGLPTIVTTNLDPTALVRLAPALGSRIAGGLLVALTGSDERIESALRAQGAKA